MTDHTVYSLRPLVEELETEIRCTWRAMHISRKKAVEGGLLADIHRRGAMDFRARLLTLLDIRRAGLGR